MIGLATIHEPATNYIMRNCTLLNDTLRSCHVLFVLSVFFLNSSAGYTQNWDWQNPLPQGVNLFSVHFPNDTIGYTVGMDGTILKTINGGDDWFPQVSGVSTTFSSVFFPQIDTGYVVGYANTIHKTINGGADWFELPSPSPGLTDVFFVNTNLGYAVGSNGVASTILKTINGGLDWEVQNVGTVTFYNSVFFVNESIGYVSGGGGRILKTTDGGDTWVNQTSGTTQTITSLYFTDEQIGYGVANARILKTTNGGDTWTIQTIFQANELYSVKFTDANTGYVVGRSGDVLKTTNAGTSWSFLTTETNITLRSVFFTDTDTGVAVGESGIMMKTTDAGLNWLPFSTSEYYEDLNDAHFPSDCNGFAVGDNGSILKTIDGGANWITQNSGVSNELYAVHFTSADVGYVVGAAGLISKTIDGGTTWSNQTSGLTVDLMDVYFTGPDTGFVVGDAGIILSTIDGGSNWYLLESNVTNGLTGIHFVDADLGFVVGSSGRVLKTTDGGSTWNILFSGTTLDLNSVYFPTPQIGYLVGVSGHIRKTINGGTNWTQQTNNINIALTSIAFTDANIGYAVGYDYNRYGKIYQTTNGGTTWTLETISWDHDLNAVQFVDANTVYIVGINGAILKTKMPSTTAENTGPVCEGETIALSATTLAGASYSWSGPNGFSADIQDPIISDATTDMAGEYSVLISINNCTSTIETTTISVHESPDTPVIIHEEQLCAGDPFVLETSSVPDASYLWTGPNGFSSTDQNPLVSDMSAATMSGTYMLTTTVNNCTSAAGESTIEINDIPATPVITNAGSFCEGSYASLSTPDITNAIYSWTGPNGFFSNEQNPILSNTANIDLNGTYSLTTTVEGCNSLAAETAVLVNAIPSTPTIILEGIICEGAPLALSTPSIPDASYAWIGPNGFTSTEQNPLISEISTLDMSGTYTLTNTVNDCTSAVAELVVEIQISPDAPLVSNNGPLCEGSALVLNAENIPDASYSWTGPNGFTSSEQNPMLTSNSTTEWSGNYEVFVTLGNCSSVPTQTSVIVHPIPDAPEASSNGPVDEGTLLTLFATNVSGATYSWTGPNGFTSSEQNPIVSEEASLAMAGNYEVSVTVNGCESELGVVLVVVNETNNIIDSASDFSVRIYPNPSSKTIWIDGSGVEFTQVEIVNALGEVVIQELVNNHKKELRIDTLAPGIYVVVLSGEGKRVEEKLMVD
jgi:photosystem II stability/assembly factor-like uncharacterized protein